MIFPYLGVKTALLAKNTPIYGGTTATTKDSEKIPEQGTRITMSTLLCKTTASPGFLFNQLECISLAMDTACR
jgi:hypothetical protein